MISNKSGHVESFRNYAPNDAVDILPSLGDESHISLISNPRIEQVNWRYE